MKHSRGNVYGLPGWNSLALFAKTHFAGPFQNEVDLLLRLVMPRNLSAVRIECYMAQGKVGGLNGTGASYDVLSEAAGGIAAPGYLRKIGDHHTYSISHLV